MNPQHSGAMYIGYWNGYEYRIPAKAFVCFYCDLCVKTPIHQAWFCFANGYWLYKIDKQRGPMCPIEWRLEDGNQDIAGR